MNSMELWLTPLLLLPGVALLILSTSARYEQIHNEIHHLMHEDKVDEEILSNLFIRSKLFKNSLVNLYLCVSIFATAGLLGGLISVWTPNYHWIVTSLSGLGILFFLISAILLIKESKLSIDIIELHYNNLTGRNNQK